MTRNFSRGFTLFELLVVIVIIAILFSIAFPAYTSFLERAKITKDLNNLRQVGLAIQTYLNDHDQLLPATTLWPGTTVSPVLFPKYTSARKIFQSPFDNRGNPDTDPAPVSYSINANMYVAAPGINRSMASVVSPTSTILMAPTYAGDPLSTASWTGLTTNAPDLPVGAPAETRGTHSNGRQINALFCDNHVENMTFGPAATAGTFQDSTTVPLGKEHWDPTFQP
jgi:prepilin-type N-terminal cleavage/methylation domain-containing protein/prepilin-type processing-associated H-X9-DG protein